MRIIVSVAFIVLAFMSSYAQSSEADKKGAEIKFLEKSKDFGDIIQGDSISYTFKFNNTGTDTLKIFNVVTTCSCTSRKYTDTPIAPGKSGEVIVSFNSKDKEGRQNKVITVLSNAINNPERVLLICNVLKK